MYFGKNMAAKIVGGRTRLEEPCREGKIRAEKKANAQNGKWDGAMAGDGDILCERKNGNNKKIKS